MPGSSELFVTIPLDQLNGPKVKIALSLPEIVNQTNSFSTKNRPGCVPTLLDSDPANLYLHYNVTCHMKDSDPRGHEVKVRFDISQVKPGSTSKDIDVRVSCSCPAFLYWGGQWNMHQRDSLEGQPRPLLAPPTERMDLRAHFLICKHCKAVFERILPSVQHNIVKILRNQEIDEKNKQPEKLTPYQRRLREREKKMKERNEKKRKQQPKLKQLQKDLGDATKEREKERLEEAIEKENSPVDRVVRDESATEAIHEDQKQPEKIVYEEQPEEETIEQPELEDEVQDIEEEEQTKEQAEQKHIQDRKRLNEMRMQEEQRLLKQQREKKTHKGLPYEPHD